jgi:hypothetical protein
MIPLIIKEKLKKVYQLVQQGTDGEQRAAKLTLDRMLAKYNIDKFNPDELTLKKFSFKYSSQIEILLLGDLLVYFNPNCKLSDFTRDPTIKTVDADLDYMLGIEVSCAYEYFKRDMRAKFKLLCSEEIKKKRKQSTKNKRRQELQKHFYNRYAIASGFILRDRIIKIDQSLLTAKQIKDRLLVDKVEPGKYYRQLQNGHLLD